MGEILRYGLGVALCGVLFVGFYRWVLYGRVSFRVARVFLVCSLVVSAIIPALRIPVWESAPVEIPYILEPAVTAGPLVDGPMVAVGEPVDRLAIGLGVLYGVGVVVLGVVMTMQVVQIARIRRGAKVHRVGRYRLAVSQRVGSPFSFLSTIYTGEGLSAGDLSRIVLHEGSHIRHGHSLERIVVQAITTLLWFSPGAWWAARLLGEVHEFEADSDVLRGGCTIDEYMPLVFRQVFGVIPEISVGLGNSITKKRFEMMTKNLKHSKMSWLRAMGVLPLAAGMLALLGFTDKEPEIVYTEFRTEVGTETRAEQAVTRTGDVAAATYGATSAAVSEGSVTVGPGVAAAATVVRTADRSQKPDTPVYKASVTVHKKTSGDGGDGGYDYVIVSQDGEVLSGDSLSPDSPVYNADQMPAFEGGDLVKFRDWVMQHMKYPKEVADAGIGGKVVVKFVVNKQGVVTNVEPMSSPDPRLSDEVARVISSSPVWTPGRSKGENVSVYYILPVEFSIYDPDKAADTTAAAATTTIAATDGGPLYVVDGEVMDRSLNEVDVNSVESIAVLKGDEAVAQYGAEGRNGVVVITTKAAAEKANSDDKVDVGYGRVSRRSRSSSVNEVEYSDKAPMAIDLRDYIQGRVVGVQFVDGKPVIRGRKSVNGDSEALVLIDGMPTNSFEEANELVDPRNIESVNVVGPTNIYGSRGANGAILIKTRKK